MEIIWKRLDDNGKKWRHVYKVIAAAASLYCIVDLDQRESVLGCLGQDIECKKYLIFLHLLTGFEPFGVSGQTRC